MNDAGPLVLVVDDDPSVRKALCRLLKAAGMQVQGFASAEEFLEQPLPDGPACIVLDLQMPGSSGLDLQRTLVEKNASVPIVFLTGHGDIPITVQAMRGGAVDFLPKPVNDRDLLAAVGQALARHAETRRAGAEAADIRQRAESLSPREHEVMELVVRGLANKQVGRQLGVTEKTVKVHRAQVMRKMGAASLPDLVRMAERMGVTSFRW
jgi:FixJ family two-component response regulator